MTWNKYGVGDITQLGLPVTITNGQAQLQVNSLSVGTHIITAQYTGDSLNNPSVSNAIDPVITGSVQFQVSATSGPQTQSIPMNVLIQQL